MGKKNVLDDLYVYLKLDKKMDEEILITVLKKYSEKDIELIIRKYGNDFTSNYNVTFTADERERLYGEILPSLVANVAEYKPALEVLPKADKGDESKIINSRKREMGNITANLINYFNNSFSLEELKMAIAQLNESEIDIIYRYCGLELDSVGGKKLSKEEKTKFSSVILPKLKVRLKNYIQIEQIRQLVSNNMVQERK